MKLSKLSAIFLMVMGLLLCGLAEAVTTYELTVDNNTDEVFSVQQYGEQYLQDIVAHEKNKQYKIDFVPIKTGGGQIMLIHFYSHNSRGLVDYLVVDGDSGGQRIHCVPSLSYRCKYLKISRYAAKLSINPN